MKTYRVLSRVDHDGQTYAEGAELALEDAQAAPLLDGGAIDGPHISPEAIQAAIRELDAEDAALWTKDGRPQIVAIASVLGSAVTAAQRDAAWAAVQKDGA